MTWCASALLECRLVSSGLEMTWGHHVTVVLALCHSCLHLGIISILGCLCQTCHSVTFLVFHLLGFKLSFFISEEHTNFILYLCHSIANIVSKASLSQKVFHKASHSWGQYWDFILWLHHERSWPIYYNCCNLNPLVNSKPNKPIVAVHLPLGRLVTAEMHADRSHVLLRLPGSPWSPTSDKQCCTHPPNCKECPHSHGIIIRVMLPALKFREHLWNNCLVLWLCVLPLQNLHRTM